MNESDRGNVRHYISPVLGIALLERSEGEHLSEPTKRYARERLGIVREGLRTGTWPTTQGTAPLSQTIHFNERFTDEIRAKLLAQVEIALEPLEAKGPDDNEIEEHIESALRKILELTEELLWGAYGEEVAEE